MLRQARSVSCGAVTLFVYCGLALALWAVVLTALGLTRPDFPGGGGAERIVVVISTVLVGLTIASGVIGGALEAAAEEEEGEREAATAALRA